MIDVELVKSPLSLKKWRIIFNDETYIDFGAKGASDYTLHKDKERKRRYLLRHSGIPPECQLSRKEHWGKKGYRTAGFWSRWLLWNKPSLEISIDSIKNLFGIHVHYPQKGGRIKKSKSDLEKQFQEESKHIYAPDKYFKGLSIEEKLKRLKRIKEGTQTDSKDKDAYRDFKTDFRHGKRIQTKPSQYTKQWNKYFPGVTSTIEKSRLTGVPLDIIEKVYNKGAAAWRTGHRPGANIQQWGHARVNSFLVKGKTFYTADHYLAKESVKHPKAKQWFNSIEGLCDQPHPKKWCKKEVIDFPKKKEIS